jgi:hypothetical protein
MKKCRVVLAGDALDDESPASVLSAQSGSGHRTIRECHGRGHRKPERVVLANGLPAI